LVIYADKAKREIYISVKRHYLVALETWYTRRFHNGAAIRARIIQRLINDFVHGNPLLAINN